MRPEKRAAAPAARFLKGEYDGNSEQKAEKGFEAHPDLGGAADPYQAAAADRLASGCLLPDSLPDHRL